jgi:hypothetical protein
MLVVLPRVASSQTDYFNTDRGRPLLVQDAHAIERYALEVQVAPSSRWSRVSSGTAWSLETALAYGLFPRTQVELAVPVAISDGSSADLSVIGVHASLLHALNVETLGMPALAFEIAGDVPIGEDAPSPYASLGLIVTRTLPFARMHLNADVTGARSNALHLDEDGGAGGHHEASRWSAGIGFDRALPLQAMLIGAEVVAFRAVDGDRETRWRTAAGVRYQAGPQWVIDAGIGRTSGPDREWSLSLGIARSLGYIGRGIPR